MIRDIPDGEKPRERAIKFGTHSVANEDLIAIILRTGTKNNSVKDLSLEVIKKIKTIEDLKKLSLMDLISIKGLKEAKAITLLAAIELGKRVYNQETMIPKMKINSTSIAYNTFRSIIEYKDQEEFMAIYLDVKKRLIGYRVLFKGTLDYSIVHPREIFKEAYKMLASSIIIMHNHPSGEVSPSHEDIELTKQLKQVGVIMGIPIIDHIIIGKDKYFSFIENDQI